jgi:signal peptidase II
MEQKTVTVGLIVSVIVVLDQVTKWLIARTLTVHESITVIDSYFHITHERNTGAAFSLLAQAPATFRQPFFLLTTMVAVTALLMFLRKIEASDKLTIIAVAGILGGAIGNFIDRVLHGEVIDFILVHWHEYHWPAFNVADSCITVGVMSLLVASFRETRKGASGASPRG